jgi:hypothetical protein
MLQQPNLFSMETPGGSAEPARQPAPESKPPAPLWLRRLELLLRVVVRLYLGLLVLILPWLHQWVDNRFFNLMPQLATFVAHGSVRGVVSGLGLLNIYIAISDAFHYRDSQP